MLSYFAGLPTCMYVFDVSCCVHFSLSDVSSRNEILENLPPKTNIELHCIDWVMLTFFVSSLSLEHSIGSSVFNFHAKLINFIERII